MVKLYLVVVGTVQYCIPEISVRLPGYEEYPDRDVGAVLVAPFRVVNVNELFILKLKVEEYSVLFTVAVIVALVVPK
jgi:hypothetical protein